LRYEGDAHGGVIVASRPGVYQLPDVAVAGDTAVVIGKRLYGAEVAATDLRGGAALTIAALSAEGRSALSGVEHLERGYDGFFEKLKELGASVMRK
ncbi:MAG: hypothetical protein J6Y44_03490, partial [Clostridia bacterium]|nr:hypothetical protein [Clostridia bacterium]